MPCSLTCRVASRNAPRPSSHPLTATLRPKSPRTEFFHGSQEDGMTINVGDRIPSTTFLTMTENGPEAVESDSYFAGRRVALFSVPGAFTPTCSAKHLPGFVEKADE